MQLTRVVLILALAIIACHTIPTPDSPDLDGTGGTGGSAPVADPCDTAAERLQELACPGVDGFADACLRARRDGLEWHPEAITCAATCNEADAAWRGEVDPCR
jgi:hypothetical protein